ncbi:hypothetical protein CLV57_0631 [Mucilaginibacter auburnensis]|uniref:Uncharacterized protein n=2 Tax=Mucilaginibacter auburnensis TaxID=1457233 RepID=A0A2H9VS50_9SPHI|nr:hypothetical protein CLV57_0631 [Mucilaginibacter auburnensis]
MMNVHEFNSLSLALKKEALSGGTFLMDHLTDDHYVKLYSLDSFYVEVYFDDSTHRITIIRAFKSTMYLQPYLNWLTVSVGLD